MTDKTWQMILIGSGSKEMCARNVEITKEVLSKARKHGIYAEIGRRYGITGTRVTSVVGLVCRAAARGHSHAGIDVEDYGAFYLDLILKAENGHD